MAAAVSSPLVGLFSQVFPLCPMAGPLLGGLRFLQGTGTSGDVKVKQHTQITEGLLATQCCLRAASVMLYCVPHSLKCVAEPMGCVAGPAPGPGNGSAQLSGGDRQNEHTHVSL